MTIPIISKNKMKKELPYNLLIDPVKIQKSLIGKCPFKILNPVSRKPKESIGITPIFPLYQFIKISIYLKLKVIMGILDNFFFFLKTCFEMKLII